MIVTNNIKMWVLHKKGKNIQQRGFASGHPPNY